MTLVWDLETMIGRQTHQWIDWDQTRKEQGNWPTQTSSRRGIEESASLDSWTKLNSEARGESSEEEVFDQGACFVLQGTQESGR